MKNEHVAVGVGLVALAVYLATREDGSQGAQTIGTWNGFPVVRTTPTGGTRPAYDQLRWDALTAALAAHNAPLQVRAKLARAMLAHAIMETGGGRAEYNWNAWNMVQNRSWSGSVFLLPGAGPNGYERAYPSIQAAADDYVSTMAGPSYGDLLAQLLAGRIDETEWWFRVMAAGFGARPSDADRADYSRVLDRLRSEFPG